MKKFKEFLRSVATIDDQTFEKDSQFFSKVNLKKEEFFVQEGKICRYIAFINKGTLRTYYLNEKSEEVTSCFCTENSLTTSYKSFIQQKPSVLNIQAIEDAELFVIDYDCLQKLYANSMVWQSIGRKVAESEYMVMEQYASILNNETAKEKYLRLLEEQPEVIEKGKIEDIASYLGVTRRTLSRIRKEITP